jgi:hypothetical protein
MAGALALALTVLAWPHPAFAYRTSYRNFDVWSDQPIASNLSAVLDDAIRRLETSALYSPSQRFRLFFCNEDWRMWLYSQHFSSAMGGVADGWLTRNIYLRRSDIPANRLLAPGGVELADADVRPLSYFVAHEAAHILESRTFGRLAALLHPAWLMEGYADLVGKGGDFDTAENLRLLQAGDPRLDYQRSGLYRGFHLLVLHALVQRNGSIHAVFDDPPDIDPLKRQLLGLPVLE